MYAGRGTLYWLNHSHYNYNRLTVRVVVIHTEAFPSEQQNKKKRTKGDTPGGGGGAISSLLVNHSNIKQLRHARRRWDILAE